MGIISLLLAIISSQQLSFLFSPFPHVLFFPPFHLFLISSAWPHSVWVLIGSCLCVSTFHQCCYMTGRLDFFPSYFQFPHTLTPTFAVILFLSSFILLSFLVPCIISFFSLAFSPSVSYASARLIDQCILIYAPAWFVVAAQGKKEWEWKEWEWRWEKKRDYHWAC